MRGRLSYPLVVGFRQVPKDVDEDCRPRFLCLMVLGCDFRFE